MKSELNTHFYPSGNLKSGFILLISVLFTLFLIGCGAYFNTYYNAKKFFSQAEKKRVDQEKKAQVSGNTNPNAKKAKIPEYTKAIEKGSKVLQLHPKSKYVDDALMLIGQSFYYTYDYLKARRKFEELISYFPNSDLAAEAKLWLGMSLIELNEYETALTVLNELVTEKLDKRISGEARLMLGELYIARGDYPAAINEFTNTINFLSDKSRKIRALYRSGEANLELQDYSRAAQAFRQALDLKPELEQKYMVELAYAKTLRKLGEYDQSLLVFDEMTKGAITKNEMANVRLEIAQNYITMKEWDKAKITFEEVALDYPNSEFSIQAFYELGRMFIKKNSDLLQAIEFFEAAGKIKKRSSTSDSVKFWLNNVKQWDQLVFENKVLEDAYYSYDFANTDTIGEYLVEESSDTEGFTSPNADPINQIQTESDSLQKKTNSDSTKSDMENFLANQVLTETDTNNKDENANSPPDQLQRNQTNRNTTQPNVNKKAKKSISVPKNFDLLETKFIENHNKLAELFLFQFDQPDSALHHYEFLSTSFDDANQAPHWLFIRSSLQNRKGNKEHADSLFQELINKYPDTEYATEARKVLGQDVVKKQIDPAESLFIKAEDQLFVEKDVEASLELYDQVVKEHKDSDFAPKAIYAMAWIAEKKQSNNEKAREIYDQLIANYPNSEMAKKAKNMIELAEKAKLAEEKRKEQEAKELAAKAVADSLALVASQSDSLLLQATETDSVQIPIKPSPKSVEEIDDLREELLNKDQLKNKKKEPPKPRPDPRKKSKVKKDSTKTTVDSTKIKRMPKAKPEPIL